MSNVAEHVTPEDQPSTTASTAEATYVAPSLSVQQEDAIIHTRITNDEKALRRVTKKFHNYTSVAYTPVIPPLLPAFTSVEDAREAFLVELASFHLSLKKSLMVCEAEARQVEEYQRERERIATEHVRLKDQIEELKTSLEHAQLQRKRKIEYDQIADKINTFPSREELERSIASLENDMATIRAEHESQNRVVQSQKSALEGIISELASLRLMGKQDPTELSRPESPAPELPPEVEGEDVDMEAEGSTSARTREESGELNEEHEEGENDRDSDDIPLAHTLNAGARPFVPSTSRTSTPVIPMSGSNSPAPIPSVRVSDEDDIEMGELAEEPKVKKKAREEELEEGEASDMSSELSDPPDD
ncbi:hypothetical protein CERSUDRAFT_111173 [Gelatoporia subvermispora B]|uniref:THO complex subunit 7 n=1 Tax=Ceriporiopsis subvermispora (strain B) TaxID=914234 RepID=M2QU37_CERS8|nr:hypothetical protein CERSUDRAFT_111173 [Gelatoporia subvermispora B]